MTARELADFKAAAQWYRNVRCGPWGGRPHVLLGRTHLLSICSKRPTAWPEARRRRPGSAAWRRPGALPRGRGAREGRHRAAAAGRGVVDSGIGVQEMGDRRAGAGATGPARGRRCGCVRTPQQQQAKRLRRGEPHSVPRHPDWTERKELREIVHRAGTGESEGRAQAAGAPARWSTRRRRGPRLLGARSDGRPRAESAHGRGHPGGSEPQPRAAWSRGYADAFRRRSTYSEGSAPGTTSRTCAMCSVRTIHAIHGWTTHGSSSRIWWCGSG